jgi:hypothetical protein
MPFDPGTGLITGLALQPGTLTPEYTQTFFNINANSGSNAATQLLYATSTLNTAVVLSGTLFQEIVLAEGLKSLLIPMLSYSTLSTFLNFPLTITSNQIIETPTFFRSVLSFILPASVITTGPLPITWTLTFIAIDGQNLTVTRAIKATIAFMLAQTS